MTELTDDELIDALTAASRRHASAVNEALALLEGDRGWRSPTELAEEVRSAILLSMEAFEDVTRSNQELLRRLDAQRSAAVEMAMTGRRALIDRLRNGSIN